MLMSSYAKVSLLVHVVVLTFALLRGRPTTRLAALIVLAGALATVLMQDRAYPNFDTRLLVIEGLQCLAFTTLAVRTRSISTMVLAALSLFAVLLHLAKMIDQDITIFPYLTIAAIQSYAILAVLVVATLTTHPQTKLHEGIVSSKRR